MQQATPATLKNMMLTGNTVGVAVHENGKTLTNFAIYDPYIGKSIFLHGRDLIKKDASYDANGKLVIDTDKNGNLLNSPFAQEAYDIVEHYFDATSLSERRATIVLGIDDMVADEVRAELIHRLSAALPDAGIQQLYDAEVARKVEKRDKMKADPEQYVSEAVDELSAQLASIPDDGKPLLIAFLKTMITSELRRYIDQIAKETGQKPIIFRDDNTIDFDAFKTVMKAKIANIDNEPINALREIKSEITELVCQHKPCNLKEAFVYQKDEFLAAADTLYDQLLKDGVLEHKARVFLSKIIEMTKLPGTLVDRYVNDLRQYDFDPEQTTNLLRGITHGGFDSIEDVPTEELIKAGKHYKVEQTLKELTVNFGNPFAGKLMEQEAAVAEEIATAVPSHILVQGCKDGLCLHVDVGDAMQSRKDEYVSEYDLFAAGGYRLNSPFGHPFIHLSPGKFRTSMTDDMRAEAGQVKSLGQLARHEYRHYWADHGGHLGNPVLPAAVEAEQAHFATIQQAIAATSSDAAQQHLIDELAEALGCADASDKTAVVAPAIKKIRHICEPWLIKQMEDVGTTEPSEDGDRKRSTGYYAAGAETLEEVFPRVDEVAMVYGDEVARLVLPNTYALMQQLEGSATTKSTGSGIARSPRGG